MLNSVAELNEFHRFAEERLLAGEGASLEDCWAQWLAEQECRKVQAAILEGLADAESGRLHSLEEVDREMRTLLGIASDG